MSTNPLAAIADNPVVYDELRRTLLSELSIDRSLLSGLDNEKIGEVVRARLEATRLVEGALQAILRHKTTEPKPEQGNPAR